MTTKSETQTLMVLGGSDRQNGDFTRLKNAAKRKTRLPRWAVPKLAKKGNRVLIYVSAPNSAIVARGVILNDATKGVYWDYESPIGHVEMANAPIGIDELREVFPDWGWLRYPRNKLHLSNEKSKRLWRRFEELRSTVEKVAVRVSGAGFGNAVDNKQVEEAAIKLVTRHYRSKGYKVISRESERVGYDLDAVKGGRELHVEVKGIKGELPKFVMTENEVQQAEKDRAFRLAIVTLALNRHPRLKILTGAQFLDRYEFRPIAHIAELA